jgi:hypothetical protein
LQVVGGIDDAVAVKVEPGLVVSGIVEGTAELQIVA